MSENEILKKCSDAFPGMSSKPDLNYTLDDLENSTLNNRNNLLRQTELAKNLGFPSSESIVDRASVAKACVDHFQSRKDSSDVNDLLNQYRKKLADATLHGGKEAPVLSLGEGTLGFHQRLYYYQAPELNESQKKIVAAISASPDLKAEVKQTDKRNDFWVVVTRK